MNAKLLFKTVFSVLVLLLLVMIGMYNKELVSFSLPPLLVPPLKQPAAIMYAAFFGLGLLTGTILTAGGGKKGAGGAPKPAKSGK